MVYPYYMERNAKPYHLMTPAERLKARMAQNKQIDANVEKTLAPVRQYNSMVASALNAAVGEFLKIADDLTVPELCTAMDMMAKLAGKAKRI